VPWILSGNTFVSRIWFPRHWRPYGKTYPYYDEVPLRLVAPLGLLTIVGICLWARSLYVIVMPMTCFLALFYLLLDENRRILPVSGLLFSFACLAVWSLYGRFVRGRRMPEQRRLLLRSDADQAFVSATTARQ
jgi:hypothetical protein